MKKIFILLAISSFLISGCGPEKEKPATRPVVSSVEIKTIYKAPVEDYYETSATAKSKISSVVSSMTMGQITSLIVKEGDRVRAGQLLLTIDSRETAQKALGAQAGINEAMKAVEAADQNRRLTNKTYQRYENLYRENVITRQEFDEISTQKSVADIEYQRAMAGANRARAGLGEVGVYQSYSRITAPISGIVVQKNTDIGSMAAPGQPLLTIENPSNLELVANISENMTNKITTGIPVYIETDSKIIKSRIISIIPNIDPMTRTFKAKIALSGLNSGEYAKVKIPVAAKETVAVPKEAIVQKGQLTGVYTVDNKNIISYRLIRTGKTFNNSVEVLSGLNSGDRVITSGADRAVDGGEVK